MKTVPVDSFTRHIAPMVDSAPDFAIRAAVVSTIIDICRTANCVTTQTGFTTKHGKREYEIPLADGLKVEQVRYVFCGGSPVHVKTMDEVYRQYEPLDFTQVSGTPLYFTFRSPDSIILTPAPDKEYRVSLVVSVGIGRDAENVPDIFYEDFLDTVVYGALSRLYKTAGQAFSNFRLAAEYEVLYRRGLGDIMSDSYRDFSRTQGRVRFQKVI